MHWKPFDDFVLSLSLSLPLDPVLVLSLQWPGTCSGSILFSWTCWSGSHCPLWGTNLQPWHLTRPCAPEVAPGLTYQSRTQTNDKTLTVKRYSIKTREMTLPPNLDLTSLSGSKSECPAANWTSHARTEIRPVQVWEKILVNILS